MHDRLLLSTLQVHITTPQEYARVAKERCPNIHIEYVPKESIGSLVGFLERKWENVIAIPGTHGIHFVQAHGSDKVMVAATSDSTELRVSRIRRTRSDRSDEESSNDDVNHRSPDCELTLSVGQWVVVGYDGAEYLGEITVIDNNDVEVNVMHKSGSAWRWPAKADKIFYERQNILRVINPPKAAGNRGQFLFENLQY